MFTLISFDLKKKIGVFRMGDIFLFFTQYVCPLPSHVLFFIQLCNKFKAIFQLSFIFKGKLYQIKFWSCCFVSLRIVWLEDETSPFFSGVPYIFVGSHLSLSFEMIYCSSFSLQARREWERDHCSSNTHVSLEYYDCYLYPSAVCFFNFLVFSCNLIVYM